MKVLKNLGLDLKNKKKRMKTQITMFPPSQKYYYEYFSAHSCSFFFYFHFDWLIDILYFGGFIFVWLKLSSSFLT